MAKLWGYATFHALARGVVTPRGTHCIILFVQEKKPDHFTPYANALKTGICIGRAKRDMGMIVALLKRRMPGTRFMCFTDGFTARHTLISAG